MPWLEVKEEEEEDRIPLESELPVRAPVAEVPTPQWQEVKESTPQEPPTPQNVRGQKNREELLHAIEQAQKAGYEVPHFIGTENEPEGDRAPTMDQENLVAALKKQEEDQRAAGNTSIADGIAKDRASWEEKIKTEGMSAEQWKKQTGESEPTRWQEVKEELTASKFRPLHDVGIVTAYRPGGDASMGLNKKVEGPDLDAHDQPILGRTTVEDYQAGRGDYVTVAMDINSQWQDQFLSSPSFPGTVFRVRDNGGYGNGKTKENWVDIAYTDPQKAASVLLRGIPFTPISVDEAQKISESRPNLDHTPRLRALAVPGGNFSYEEPTGLPDPFVEVTARAVRGAETGTREMFGGALSITEAATRGERNVYLDEEEPEETAQGDIPRLEEQIATLKKELHDRTLKEDPSSANWAQYTTFDSPEIGKLDKQLKDARRAAAGDLRENVLGSISRQTERLASEAEKNQVEAMKKYQPYISQARDTKWGFMLADALGTTVPGVLASIGNPIFGATAIYAQIYQASMQQYMAEKPEATREQAQKFANDQALAQVPWAIVGNQLTARALKASFATLPAGAVERGARIFGTQVGQAVSKNAQAFIGNVGSAIGQSMMSDMVSEDYDLLEDTDLGEKFTRSLEPASLAGGVSLIFGGAGMAGALAKRPGAKPKAEAAPKEVPTGEITLKALPAPKEAAPKAEAPSTAEPVAAEWIVQHASPHSFERFALASIGTGEGHQAFGRGLYFSEGVSTHKSYMEQFGGEGKAVSYKVKINANKDHFIDWDKPISEQGEFVKDKLKAAGILDPDGTLSFKVVTPNEKARSAKMPVSEFVRVQLPYADMTAIKMAAGLSLRSPDYPINSPQGAAEFLNSIGIKGIRYLDAANRGKEEGTRNIVIFDENIVEILEKNGKPVAPKPIQKTLPAPEAGTELARYGPLAPGATRPAYEPTGKPPELPPSTSIVPGGKLPKGHIISIVPVIKNPIMRRHVNYAPGQRAGFGGRRSPIGDWKRFFIGAAEVMEKTPGLERLGQKLRDYVDDKALFYAQENNWARKFEKTVNAKEKGIAQQEFHRFFLQSQDPDVNVQKKAVETYWAVSEKGRELIDQTRDYLNRTGIENQEMGFVVLDPAINDWRPIGKVAGGGDPIPPVWYPGWKPGYFPRMIHPDHMKIIRDPTADLAAYEALKDHVEAMGFPRDSIDSHLGKLKAKASSNEFFASVDLARTSKLPNTTFDYSFETVRRYMAARAERKAQVKNFGQKKAHSGPDSLTEFDRYIDNTDDFLGEGVRMDAYTKNYVERVRDNVLNIQTAQAPEAKAVQKLGTMLTGLHLGDPLVASRNLAGGQSTIFGILGAKHYLKGVKDAFTNIDEAYEKGIILHDMANLMEQSEGLGGYQNFTNWALKVSGEAPAENFNRMVNLGAAKSLLRDALDEYKTNPLGRKSRGYFGHFKRMGGIDPQALMDEDGKGPMTDRYLRQSVRYIQGGYQIDQTPLFQNTENAKFFFKYNKWGTQHTDLFSKEVIRPALRELSLGKAKKEFVEIRNPETGKMEKHAVPGKLDTAMRYFLAMAAGGYAATQFARYAFGAEDKTESWTELARKLDKDGQEAFAATLYKLFQYSMVTGAGGYLGNVAQYGLDWTQKTRVKDPVNPPMLDLAKSSLELIGAAVENGGVPRFRDFDQYLRRNVSAYRTGWKAAAYYGNDVFPLGFRALKRESMLQDLKWRRGVIQRYEEQQKVAAPSPWKPGTGSQSPMSRFNYDVKEALNLGDVAGARQLIDKRFAGLTESQRKSAMRSLMASVRDGRMQIGGSPSSAAVAGFLRWADTNMSKADAAKLRRMDETYMNTAVAARILEPGGRETTLAEEEEKLRSQQMKTELREQE